MALWHFRKTHQDHSGAEKFAWISDLEHGLLYQHFASAFNSPIVKNLAPMMNILVCEGPQIMAKQATLVSGYGGLVTGQIIFQPLQGQSASSGGL